MKSFFISHSQKETKDFAKNLARQILLQGSLQGSDPCKDYKGQNLAKKNALVLGLEGELGAGKTTFVQGFAKGLKLKENILSPTFVILKKYAIPKSSVKSQKSSFTFFYHIDCYRLHKPTELERLGFQEIVSNPNNIVLIEWADHIRKILPQNSWHIVFTPEGRTIRRISFSGERSVKGLASNNFSTQAKISCRFFLESFPSHRSFQQISDKKRGLEIDQEQ